jgi:hypothetical protein
VITLGIQGLLSELADNWPAFVYIALTVGFSICFLRERRAEVQALRQIGAELNGRIEKVERILMDR